MNLQTYGNQSASPDEAQKADRHKPIWRSLIGEPFLSEAEAEAEAIIRSRIGRTKQRRLHVYGCLLHVALYPFTLLVHIIFFFVSCVPYMIILLNEMCEYEPEGARLLLWLVFLVLIPVIPPLGFVVHFSLAVPLDILLLIYRPCLLEEQCKRVSYWWRPSALVFAYLALVGEWSATFAHIFLGAMPASSPIDSSVVVPHVPEQFQKLIPCMYFHCTRNFTAGARIAFKFIPRWDGKDWGLTGREAKTYRIEGLSSTRHVTRMTGGKVDNSLVMDIALDKLKCWVTGQTVPETWQAMIKNSVIMSWALVLDDDMLVRTWISNVQTPVNVTVRSVGGDLIYGPQSFKNADTIGALLKEVKGSLHIMTESGSCLLLAGSSRELRASEHLLDFTESGDVDFTLVRRAG